MRTRALGRTGLPVTELGFGGGAHGGGDAPLARGAPKAAQAAARGPSTATA